MEIKAGKIYLNKTKKYLLPIIKDYGQEFITNFNSLFKLGIGINDIAVPKPMNLNNHLFMLFDTNTNKKLFIDTLKWIRKKPYFEFDYPYDDILHGHQHMIVIKVPENHKITYEKFIKNKFSEMYSKDTIDKYFKNGDIRIKVLTKSEDLLKNFVDNINSTFDEDYKYEEWDGEIEYPIDNNDEIFNFELKQYD